jgi:hypothetical protein
MTRRSDKQRNGPGRQCSNGQAQLATTSQRYQRSTRFRAPGRIIGQSGATSGAPHGGGAEERCQGDKHGGPPGGEYFRCASSFHPGISGSLEERRSAAAVTHWCQLGSKSLIAHTRLLLLRQANRPATRLTFTSSRWRLYRWRPVLPQRPSRQTTPR